jgi:glycosyltransferase involved in cell wall biosynthesis
VKFRPRVSLIRGPYFGAFEAQNFAPLLDRFDVQAYILPQNPFDLEGCDIPIHICLYPDSRWFGNRSLINAWRSRVLGQKYPMPGIDAIVRRSCLVHTFEAWYTCTQQAARSCRTRKIPMVVTHWDTRPYVSGERERLLPAYDSAAAIIAPSEASRRALIEMGVAEEKIVRLGMGVDAERFSPGPRDEELVKQAGFDGTDFIFLYMGRFAPEKGLHGLLEAFHRLQQPACRLLMIGSGPEESRLKLGPNAKLIPSVSYRDAHRWHRLADCFVYPSRSSRSAEEQFGYSLVESMSCGKAVIATRVGGIPDVVGEAGILVAQDDVLELTAAMTQLQSDLGLREKLGRAARLRVLDRFSAQYVSGRLAELYANLLTNRHR